MKEILKLGISLFIFCAVAALALAFTNELTKGPIAELRAKKELEAKQAVLPSAMSFEEIEESKLEKIKASLPLISDISLGKKGEEIVGYVIKSIPQGYGGEIVVISGLDTSGKINGVRIAKHSESPGLGSKAQEPEFYEQYNGKLASSVEVTKGSPSEEQIVAIASATITSKAVTQGVNASGEAIKELGN